MCSVATWGNRWVERIITMAHVAMFDGRNAGDPIVSFPVSSARALGRCAAGHHAEAMKAVEDGLALADARWRRGMVLPFVSGRVANEPTAHHATDASAL
jgi:hypothetical protein